MSSPEQERRPTIDLVIAIDTSVSLKDEAVGISQAAEAAIEAARSHCPADLRVLWLGVEGTWRDTHFSQTIRSYLTETCDVPEASLRQRKRGELPGAGAQEDGARAIEDIANHLDWRAGTKRAVLYLSDEALDGGGSRVDAEDIEAANVAIEVAQQTGLTVHTYFGTTRSRQREALEAEFKRVAESTGGRAFTSQDSLDGFGEMLKAVICVTQKLALEAQPQPTQPETSEDRETKPQTDSQLDPVTEADSSPANPPTAPQPTGEQASIPADSETYHEAICILKNYVIAAMGIGLLPVPIVDFVALSALQMRMIHHLSELYKVPFNDHLGRSILASISGGFVSSASPRWAASLFKLVPGVGPFYGLVAMSSISGASTYAVGRAFINLFEQGQTLSNLDRAHLKQDVQHFQEEGKHLVGQLKNDIP